MRREIQQSEVVAIVDSREQLPYDLEWNRLGIAASGNLIRAVGQDHDTGTTVNIQNNNIASLSDEDERVFFEAVRNGIQPEDEQT